MKASERWWCAAQIHLRRLLTRARRPRRVCAARVRRNRRHPTSVVTYRLTWSASRLARRQGRSLREKRQPQRRGTSKYRYTNPCLSCSLSPFFFACNGPYFYTDLGYLDQRKTSNISDKKQNLLQNAAHKRSRRVLEEFLDQDNFLSDDSNAPVSDMPKDTGQLFDDMDETSSDNLTDFYRQLHNNEEEPSAREQEQFDRGIFEPRILFNKIRANNQEAHNDYVLIGNNVNDVQLRENNDNDVHLGENNDDDVQLEENNDNDVQLGENNDNDVQLGENNVNDVQLGEHENLQNVRREEMPRLVVKKGFLKPLISASINYYRLQNTAGYEERQRRFRTLENGRIYSGEGISTAYANYQLLLTGNLSTVARDLAIMIGSPNLLAIRNLTDFELPLIKLYISIYHDLIERRKNILIEEGAKYLMQVMNCLGYKVKDLKTIQKRA
ncbi:uncharacterized protein LOC107980542 [Nasonia vitripennis]|uniref:Uncharacterized protein n=1 Tax=Nasonia vitripennis TaxID=7425 RepID=A0A7M7Q187_NASVI|nr:uncharacterized protein LOC107980542 [Nasonia vitripennis]XP_031779306.1 uncharacterized protein LOC107980542 [Nasonia vitripennis]XP_031779337.1 uncharacterized protein LOC107980542 [Nasonia vitripennis]XP_031779369.1 uncharacterized protein LOC107980542 [Nasonia vitripennis]XP_032457113.1 uncharacterized protein LOC107980542 [Nasonia vitripennis]XP_032457114.1 uncharacterized protein LOC107980542 [Nasonia vitripennis]